MLSKKFINPFVFYKTPKYANLSILTLLLLLLKIGDCGDYPVGPVVKNQSSNEKNKSFNPGWGTKVPHATWQLCLWATTTEPAHYSLYISTRKDFARGLRGNRAIWLLLPSVSQKQLLPPPSGMGKALENKSKRSHQL